MTVPKFSFASRYTVRDGDFVVLPYCSEKTACFPRALLPPPLAKAAGPPEKRGGKETVFCGSVNGKKVIARAARLDAEHSDAAGEIKQCVSSALTAARDEGCRRVVVLVGGKHADLVLAAQEGALLGGYRFETYLSEKKDPLGVMAVMGAGAAQASLKRALSRRAGMFACVNFARDVLNEPPNVCKPPALAREFRKMGKASGLKVTVWDDKRLARERCGGILAVGQGSAAKPRLVRGEYRPRGARKHLCLVGKGVTFDSGGYCLKPADSQIGMKYDMAGAAMMFAAACAIARLALPLRVTVLTPLVENAIAGDAYMNTSVLTTRSGRTIEVHSTDAEGRLILADALALGAEGKPDWIVDAATLTGACVVALGDDLAAAFGTDPDFTASLMAAGSGEGELFWELPLHMPYAERLKTTIADCKNTGGRPAGSITGALFLKQWVPDGMKWIHCDIAGPGGKEDAFRHLDKGAKGFGVKTIVALAEKLSGKK
jgi:leucyl aminopeptidase